MVPRILVLEGSPAHRRSIDAAIKRFDPQAEVLMHGRSGEAIENFRAVTRQSLIAPEAGLHSAILGDHLSRGEEYPLRVYRAMLVFHERFAKNRVALRTLLPADEAKRIFGEEDLPLPMVLKMGMDEEVTEWLRGLP